jgi:hypothetical protein
MFQAPSLFLTSGFDDPDPDDGAEMVPELSIPSEELITTDSLENFIKS